jgi:CRP-like cAMP-binding protein
VARLKCGIDSPMTIEDDIAFLERVPALAVLGRDALRIIAIGAENRYVHEGNTLFTQGEDADAAFVVQEGSFDLTADKNGAATVAARGALIGEFALLTETKRPVTAVAREPSSVVRIPRQLFLKTLEGYPEAALRMRDAIAARVNRTTGEFARVRTVLARGTPARK